MSQNLDKAFRKIQKESENLAIKAMMNAANEAFNLAVEKANSCLDNYLKRKPKIYKRLNPSPLKKALIAEKPQFSESGGHCYIGFSLTYDSTIIKGAYESNSPRHESGEKWVSRFIDGKKFNPNSSDNGIPDSGWILSNYLEGKHGWVDDDGNKPIKAPFIMGWKDDVAPGDTMKYFFEHELHEKAGPLIYKAMQGVIVDFLKTNGGGK